MLFNAKKLASCFCVAIMVIVGLQVLTERDASASGTEINNPISKMENSSSLVSQNRILTLSNLNAGSPSMARGQDASLNLAWVDSSKNGEKIMWKRSSDNGRSFSPDKVISPEFQAIDRLDIAASEQSDAIAVAISGCVEAQKDGVFLLYSIDSGTSWSRCYYVEDGDDPQVQIWGKDVIISFKKVVDGTPTLVLGKLVMEANQVTSGSALLSMEVGGPYAMTVAGNAVHYAFSMSSPMSAIVYGCLDMGSKNSLDPRIVCKLEKGSVGDLSIVMTQNVPVISWSRNADGEGFIESASGLGSGDYWLMHEVAHEKTAFGLIDACPTPEGVCIMWEGSYGDKSWIECAELSVDGKVLSLPKRLSPLDAGARSPCAATGRYGDVFALWSDRRSGHEELWGVSDALFILPDLSRLKAWLEDDRTQAFFDRNGKAAQDILQRLSLILASLNDSSEKLALEQISQLRAILGDGSGLLSKTFAQDAIAAQIDAQLRMMESELYGSDPLPLYDGGYSLDSIDPPPEIHTRGPTFSNITATSAVADWELYPPPPPPYEMPGECYFSYWKYPSGTVHTKIVEAHEPDDCYFTYQMTGLDPGTIYSCHVNGSLSGEGSGTFETQHFEVRNITTSVISQDTVDIDWCTNLEGTTRLYYGVSSYNENLVSGADGSFHHLHLTGLASSTIYMFKIVSSSVDGTGVNASTEVLTFRTNMSIAGVRVTTDFDSATITWNTTMNATGEVSFGEDQQYLLICDVQSYGKSHVAILTGLTASANYNVRIRATFIGSQNYYATNYTSFWSTEMAIQNITSQRGADHAQFNWNTTDNATAEVFYGTSPSTLNSHVNGTAGLAHEARIQNLTKQTTYYYRLVSHFVYDAEISDEATGNLQTLNYALSSVQSNLIDRNANGTYNVLITWHSSFFGTGKVYYSTHSDLPPLYTKTVLGNNTWDHAVKLNFLTGNTRFYYKVESKPVNDPPASALVSSVKDFETKFYISNLAATMVNATAWTISWTTNYASSTTLCYNTSQVLSRTATGSSGVTSHSITLSGLKQGETYYYQARSEYSSTMNATSRMGSFLCGVITISGLRSDLWTTTSANVSWRTNIGATGVVQYAQCDLKDARSVWKAGDYLSRTGSGDISHLVSLLDLQPNATYVYRVVSVSLVDGRVSKASDYSTFRTEIAITGVSATATDTSVTVKWTTNIRTNSWVYYGTAASYGSSINGYDGRSHSVTITGLVSNQLYHFKVSSGDGTLTAYGPDGVVRTSAVMISNVAVPDSTISSTGATITWTTSFAATGFVDYGLTSSYGSRVTGSNGTSHSIPITGLTPGSTYHYRATSASLSNSSDLSVRGDFTFMTVGQNDAGSWTDAGNSQATALEVVSSKFKGALQSGSDQNDFYKFYVFSGQRIKVDLTVPSGFNYNLYLYNPAGTQKASSTNGGSAAETVSFTADSEGYWKFEARWISGSGKNYYDATLQVLESATSYNLDVGVSGDMTAADHLPGLVLCDNTGWGGIQSSPTRRTASAGSGFLLNLDSETQSRDYQITIRYYATQNVTVSVVGSAGSANLTKMVGNTSWTSSSFIVSNLYLFDYRGDLQGINVRFNLSAPAEVDTIKATPYTATQSVNETRPPVDLPNIKLETGWTVKDSANGTAGATMILSLPRGDISYMLTLMYANATEGIEVQQQQSSSVYKTVGTTSKFGQQSFVQLNREWYYDTDVNSPGINIRIKFLTALNELSSFSLTPSMYSDDVGTTGDDSMTTLNPGVCIKPSQAEWSSASSQNGRTYRTASSGAYFYLNSPLSDTPYRITIAYKTTTANVKVSQWAGGTSWDDLSTLANDGQWHQISFLTKPSKYFDHITGAEMNVLFRFSGTVTVDWMNASADHDNDTLSTFDEAFRSYELDPTVRTGPFSKTFTCWNAATYSIGLDIALDPEDFFILGIRFPGWVSYAVTLDGQQRLSGIANAQTRSEQKTITIALQQGTHTLAMQVSGNGTVTTNSVTIRNAYSLNPFAADTDNDGWDDGKELTKGTNPTIADTDCDGLPDGQEKYSYMWSSDTFSRIPDTGPTGNPAKIYLGLPRVTSGTTTAVYAHTMVTHNDSAQLKVTIQRYVDAQHYGSPVTLWDNGASQRNLFISWNLLEHGFTVSDFQSAATYILSVYDEVQGISGRVESFKLEMRGETDPLNADTDGDRILDGEEVNLGADGWTTDPCLADSDSDGLTDANEIHGWTPSLKPSDPTRNDTDGDGFMDGSDIDPTGDALVKIYIYELYHDGGDYFSPVFFTIEANGVHYATARTSSDTMGWIPIGLTYYIDVWDSNSTMDIKIRGWDDNNPPSGDSEIDICPGPSKQMDISYSLQNNRYADQWGTVYVSAYGRNDGYEGEQDADVAIQVSTVTKQKANTIVINGTDYGLDAMGRNEYRYSADDQLYLFYLNCSSSYGHFVQGLNVVLLPRSLALASQVNSTLANLQGIGQDDPLNGASFARTNASRAEASGHVIAVISKNLTGAKAEELLSKMTHNATGSRIGNNVTVPSTESLFLLHLPSGVLAMIPWLGVSNSELGGQPHGSQSFWDWLCNSVVDVVRFVWNGLVAVATFMRDIGNAIIDFGLKVLCAIASAYAAVVKAAVDAIVDAFMAFVNWVIEFVGDIVNSLLGPVINPIISAIADYRHGVLAALGLFGSDIKNGGSVMPSSRAKLDSALNAPLYWVIVGLTIVVSIILVAISVVTNIFSFLLFTAIGLVASMIVTQAFPIGALNTNQSGSEEGNEATGSVSNDPDGFSDVGILKVSLQVVGVDGGDIADPDIRQSWELGLNIIAAAWSQFASKLSYAVLAGSGIKFVWGACSIIAGLLGCVFGVAGATGHYDPLVEFVCAFTGFAYSIESLIFGGAAIVGTDPFSRNVGIVGGIIGFTSLMISIGAALVAVQEGS